MSSIVCRIFGHSRSAKRARFDYDAQRWRSVCRLCEAPMTKEEDGTGWRLDEPGPADA